MHLKKLSNNLGAEVLNIDLQNLSVSDIRILRAALARYQILCFRDQPTTAQELSRFSRLWGELEISDSLPLDADVQEVAILLSEPDKMRKYGGVWHIEYGAHEVGAAIIVLQALDVPESGGNTLFTNLISAFDALPSAIQEQIRPLSAVRQIDPVLAKYYATQAFMEKMARSEYSVVHPVVRTHPITGREILFVDQGFTRKIVGMETDRGTSLLDFLKAHTVNQEFVYAHKWCVNDILVFDNRSLQHKAECNYVGMRRELRRCLVRDTDPPFYLENPNGMGHVSASYAAHGASIDDSN